MQPINIQKRVPWPPTGAPVVSSQMLVCVADVMLPTRILISPNAYLYEVLGIMQQQRVPCLVVEPLLSVGAWGIVTLRDVQIAFKEHRRDTPRVREVTIRPPFVVAPRMRIEDCSALMLATGQRRIVVVQANRPVGIITDSDLFQAIEARG